MVHPLQAQTLDKISNDLLLFKNILNERGGVLARATIFPTGEVMMMPIGRRMQSVGVLKSLLKVEEDDANMILGRLREPRDENEVVVVVTRLGEDEHEFAVVKINDEAA